MVRTIEEKEIMTSLEAREKYAEYYIGFVVTEQKMTDPDNSKGYVVYVMDTRDEGYTIPRWTEDGLFISLKTGQSTGGSEITSVFFEDI